MTEVEKWKDKTTVLWYWESVCVMTVHPVMPAMYGLADSTVPMMGQVEHRHSMAPSMVLLTASSA